jgi:hypothetical protein
VRGWYARRARFLFVERGLRRGDRFWLVVGGVVVGQRVLKRTFGRSEQGLTTETLRPGQSVTISVVSAPKRAERRALKQQKRRR